MTLPYPVLISILFRIVFIFLMIMANAKMIEYKIRSFAAIGASLTVVTAFIANYLFNLLYEILLYYKFPSMNQYIGSIFCLAGVYVLKDQIANTREHTDTSVSENDESFGKKDIHRDEIAIPGTCESDANGLGCVNSDTVQNQIEIYDKDSRCGQARSEGDQILAVKSMYKGEVQF